MIPEEKVTSIAFEKDKEKRDAMIAKLTDAEVREVLARVLNVINRDIKRPTF